MKKDSCLNVKKIALKLCHWLNFSISAGILSTGEPTDRSFTFYSSECLVWEKSKLCLQNDLK